MIEHQRRGQAPQQIRHGDDLFAAHVHLQMPAERRHAFGHRLDHVGRHHRGCRIAEAEAGSANARIVQPFQFRIGDIGMENGDASCVRAELRDGIDRGLVLGRIIARRHDDDARGADPLLQQTVLIDGGVGRSHPRTRSQREARRIVDVHMAVGGVGRRFQLRRLGACGIGHLISAFGVFLCPPPRAPASTPTPPPLINPPPLLIFPPSPKLKNQKPPFPF